jgi:WhiB family redox-sensing transcriptional regulator
MRPVNGPRVMITAASISMRMRPDQAGSTCWQLHAACRGMASSYFFHPEGERGPARARREANAKAVCHECPAMAACRAHALEVHEPYGIWGGLSEGERQQLLAVSVQAG